jgi:hypothetical protein
MCPLCLLSTWKPSSSSRPTARWPWVRVAELDTDGSRPDQTPRCGKCFMVRTAFLGAIRHRAHGMPNCMAKVADWTKITIYIQRESWWNVRHFYEIRPIFGVFQNITGPVLAEISDIQRACPPIILDGTSDGRRRNPLRLTRASPSRSCRQTRFRSVVTLLDGTSVQSNDYPLDEGGVD